MYMIWFIGRNRVSDRNINILYCPYKSGYYRVRELKSPNCSTIVCNRVGTGEVIKYIRKGLCYKLHSAITPRILARFPRSKMRRKALKKTFRTMPKTCQSDQYSSRYQSINAGHWSADISGTAKRGRLLPCAHGSSLQYASDDYK